MTLAAILSEISIISNHFKMGKEQAVAFLDLLAFSNHVRTNTKDAFLAFTTYRTILETKLLDNVSYSSPHYTNPVLQDLLQRRSANSFNHFLPFSDSIFISSDNPSLFLKQLGSFILQCFIFTAHHYHKPDDPNNPTKVIHKLDDGTTLEENLYPTLFRGGLAYGEVVPIELVGIVNSLPQKIANIAGKAVVKAVGLESKVKGPRIVFEKDLFEQLDNSARFYTAETEVQGIYELLWPGLMYIQSNGESEINDLNKLLIPAINLWKAYNHTPFSEHYFKFVQLVINGTLKVFRENGHNAVATSKIKDLIIECGLEHKINQLLKKYGS